LKSFTLLKIIVFCHACLVLGGLNLSHAEDVFPEYECITANVAFWTDVYSHYTTSQGVVHDSDDLGIIYAVIPLKPFDEPGSRKINRRRMKQAKSNYSKILRRLARTPNTSDPESRRVAGLFGSQANAKRFSRASRNVRCQVGQKDRFIAGLKRSGAYIDQIRSIFQSYGLPEDLAYLPHVESSFNLQAYSKFGAAGIWQFTRSTGKRYMQVGYVLDERRDPISATHAAAKLLRDNYNQLGTWPLAITAYNHGTTGMKRAKKLHGTYPELFQAYRSRIFKFASRNFYSEFLAARQVAGNYETYFGDIALDAPKPLHTMAIKRHIDLNDLCRHLQIDHDVIKTLNPALRQPVFSGQKYIPPGYLLRLPPDSGGRSETLFAEIPPSMYHDTQKPSLFYTVQRGDTAGKIARRHGVKISDLILANNLNHRALIYPRQTLRIPQAGEPLPAPSVKPAEPALSAVLAQADEPDEMEVSQRENEKEEPSEAPDEIEYPEPVLASVIPVPLQSAPSEQPSSRTEPNNTNLEIVAADVHIEKIYNKQEDRIGIISVEVEETLGHYAEWAKVRTSDLRRLNNLSFGRSLHLDQKVKIPLQFTNPQDFEESRYEYHKRLQEDFFAVYRISELKSYQVRSGDNYWVLCQNQFDIPMWLLKLCNPEVDLNTLKVSQKLMIPVIDKAAAQDPSMGAVEDEPMEETSQPDEPSLLKNTRDHLSP
jgi:membrane-bound lytic murein transglycosylase D